MRIFLILIIMFFPAIQAYSAASDPLAAANTPEQKLTAIDERDIAAGALHGLYVNAGEGTPIALIVPGSGPTNLNGNSGAGLRTNAYKYLAHQLAAKGISSVRVDKRGMYSSAAAGDPNAVTVEIYAKDYRDWVDAIKIKTGAQCIYLIGHSEGGLMVSSAAVGRDDVCGLILVSAMGRPMGTIMREQLKANPANHPFLRKALGAISKLENGKHVKTKNFHPALKIMFHEPVQNYLIAVIAVDPAKIAAQANQKTLIIHGKYDIQTSVKDAELLHAATKGKLVLLDKVNHVLKISPKELRKQMKIYADPDLPVADGVINAIADFMLD